MSRKTRGCPGSFFGAPADFNESQLPTYRDVGRQFLKTKVDLKSQFPNKKVTNREVALEVQHLKLLQNVYSLETFHVIICLFPE
jgi:hypothetical protein